MTFLCRAPLAAALRRSGRASAEVGRSLAARQPPRALVRTPPTTARPTATMITLMVTGALTAAIRCPTRPSRTASALAGGLGERVQHRGVGVRRPVQGSLPVR